MRTGSDHTERVTNVFSASAFQVSVWMCAQRVAAGGKIFFFFTQGIPDDVHRLVVVRSIYMMLMCSYSVLIQRMLSYNHTRSLQCIQTVCSHTVDAF